MWGDKIILYARTCIFNVCQRIEELQGILLKSYETQMTNDDCPETDISGLLNHDDHSRYHMLIDCVNGQSHWEDLMLCILF